MPTILLVEDSEALKKQTTQAGASSVLDEVERILTAAQRLVALVIPDEAGATRPAEREGAPAAAATTSDDRGAILVVDDNEGNREMLSRRLARQGYRVASAEGGRRALDLLRSGPFDPVLLDVMMPEMDGYEVG